MLIHDTFCVWSYLGFPTGWDLVVRERTIHVFVSKTPTTMLVTLLLTFDLNKMLFFQLHSFPSKLIDLILSTYTTHASIYTSFFFF
jgi:hypothetical protein